jgi:Glycosyl hydrolase family 115/Gylcosyl hydrolase family 115 C-terminal domain
MFIAKPTAGTAKLRRSGMYTSQLNRQALGSCRSYGAWLSVLRHVTINMALLTELYRFLTSERPIRSGIVGRSGSAGWALPVCAAFLTACIAVLPVISASGLGIGEESFVTSKASRSSFPLAHDKVVATIDVDLNDYAGVVRAAEDLQTDIIRVTGLRPAMAHGEQDPASDVVIAGTIGHSRSIDRLIREHQIDVASITGRWESYLIQVLAHPLPGVGKALVIAGSDQRGTIYGLYELSQQIGVSPWYWWADVPIEHKAALFVKAGRYVQGPPAVKYRGIFLNDEAPALTGWVTEKFGNYNHQFYTNVFELLLRLKANYLWPAMWNNCFNEDDPLNPKLADEYGIVMGTSHVEPMTRADKEWNRKGYSARQWNYDQYPNELRAFWREGIERSKGRENIVTIGMRGKIDTPMSESANIALLERIVAEQRKIIADAVNPNVAEVPQLWALYKEVQEYYEKGMRVPDDVTLLWCDDNWGNVRRLPTAEERKRQGGAGVYYHFDYVGGPRNYKWLNTVPISKIWDQLNLAYRYGADRIWIVNVGDLKPMEFPMEFLLTFAWNPRQWPKERLQEYGRLWAEREFGPAHAADIADIVGRYTKYNGRRKPELLEPGTFSLVDYQEADTVLRDWKSIEGNAERISRALPTRSRDAFFELVLHPARACRIVNELYLTAAKNRLYAGQGRASANELAARTRELFKEDADLSAYYNHALAGGKWNHMMDQTHIGYTYWQQPPSNIMPAVTEIKLPQGAQMGIAVEGSTGAWPRAPGEPALPVFDAFNQPQRFIEVFNRGQTGFEYTATTSAPWIRLSAARGRIEKQERLWVSVDWNQAPQGSSTGEVTFSEAGADHVPVKVNLFNPKQPTRKTLKGFVETDGCVSIEAVHYTRKVNAAGAGWEPIADYGRTLGAVTIFPVTAPSVLPPQNSPHLEYRAYLFSTGAVEVTAIIAPTLNFMPGRGLRFALSFDEEPPQLLTAVPANFFVDNGNRDWEESVKNNCRAIKSTHTIAKPGYHTLKFWMVDPAVALQKLVVNTGGVKPSYLGPPESYRAP